MILSKKPTEFIIIDDDKISNLLCRISIKSSFPESNITAFSLPDEGLAYIADVYSNVVNKAPIILLLDINMPVWSGWEFLENFEKLENLRTAFNIYIMSSSIDENDVERAEANKNVIGYIKKPFTKAWLAEIAEAYQR